MDKIHNIEEAENWFLNNPSGSVIAVKPGDLARECFSYPEAVEFFNKQDE